MFQGYFQVWYFTLARCVPSTGLDNSGTGFDFPWGKRMTSFSKAINEKRPGNRLPFQEVPKSISVEVRRSETEANHLT